MKAKILFLICFLLIFTGNSTKTSICIMAQGNDAVAIVNKNLSSVNMDEVKRIFTGKTSNWPGGGSVQVLLNNDTATAEAFCQKYLGMSLTSLNNIWVKKSVRDGVPAPRSVASNVIMTMISSSDKFIGFVKRSEAGGDVKIIE